MMKQSVARYRELVKKYDAPAVGTLDRLDRWAERVVSPSSGGLAAWERRELVEVAARVAGYFGGRLPALKDQRAPSDMEERWIS